jgi:hypothetical protein
MLRCVLAPAISLALAGAPAWEAPAGCPSVDALRDRIGALAGRVPDDTEMRVRARVDGPPWRVELELARDGAAQSRTFTAESCDALADVVAVVVAVALDPVHVAGRVEPRATPAPVVAPQRLAPREAAPREPSAPTPSAPVVGTAVVPPDGAASPRRWPPLRLALRVAGGGEIGATPRGTGGTELALSLAVGRLALEVQGRYWARRRSPIDGGSLLVELGTVGARACGVGEVSRVRLSGCAGLETGAIAMRAFDVPAAAGRRWPWLAATLGGSVAVALGGPVLLWLGLEGAAHVLRPRAVLATEPRTGVHHVAPAGFRALAGLELRLWGRPARSAGRSARP